MDGGGGERKDAARLVATGDAVLDLAAPQGGQPFQYLHVGLEIGRPRRVGQSHLLELQAGRGELPFIHPQRPDHEVVLLTVRRGGRVIRG